MWSRWMLSSPPPVHTSKIHLHMGQFSLKQPEGWQEVSATTKAVRKIYMDSVGREEKR